MAVIWKILYGFIVIYGKCSFEGSEAVEISLRKLKNLQGYSNKDFHDLYSENSKIKNDRKKRSLDENEIGLRMKTFEEDAGYQDNEKSSRPVSFLYHKTLKKIEGKPIKVKDENGMLVDSRIRVSPLGFEPLQDLDFPLMTRLSDLNNLNDVGGSRAKSSDEKASMEKLKGFLKEAIRKSNRNFVKGRHIRLANLTKGSDKFSQQWLNNGSELMKLLVAACPLQVSLSHGVLLNNFLEKGSHSKFRPEEFIVGISSDPSFSSTNEAVADKNNYVVEKKQGTKEGNSCVKTNNTLDRTSSHLIDNNSSKLANVADLTLGLNSVGRIHQSAEETVLKNVLNDLISDIPSNLGFSTMRSAENIGFINALLKDTDRIREIESSMKSAKQSHEESLSNFKDSNPCMKIRVKNGPVTLTFQSQAHKEMPRKPYTDPSNIPVFKINNDKSFANHSNLSETSSSFKNVMACLNDELNSGECSKDRIGKGNVSCYYTGNNFESIAKSCLLDHPVIGSISKNTEDVNEEGTLEKSGSKNATNFSTDQNLTPFQNIKLANCTDSSMKKIDVAGVNKLYYDNPEEKWTPKTNLSGTRYKMDERYEPSGTVAVACPFGSNSIIFPNYINGVHRFGPSKHLFLTNTGTGSYQFSHNADRLRLAAANSIRSHSDSRCKYVPKLYYNDLVVSKGLVGQHPPLDTSSPVLSDNTLKKMEMLNILKFYLDSLSAEGNYTGYRNKEYLSFNPMLKHNRKYFIKL